MFAARNHLHGKAPVFEDSLEAAISAVRSDVAPNDWVLCGFKGGDDIQLIGTGTGGIEVLKSNLVQWDVCYGLVRSAHTLEQAGYVQTDFIKFVWIYWRPDNIPVMRKMQIGVSEGEMKTLFSPYHAELQACTDDELGAGPLAEVLDDVTMRADKTVERTLRRSPSSPNLLSKGCAAWARARSSLPDVHLAHLAIANEQKKVAASAKISFETPGEFSKAIKAVRSDINHTDWCLVGYKDDSVLRIVGSGKGGLESLLDAAEPFGVNYGLLRVSEQFDLVFHEAYCFITWMPENIPAFVKARVSTHQGAVASAFRNHVHCQFHFRGAAREDITMKIIRARVRQIIGKDPNYIRKGTSSMSSPLPTPISPPDATLAPPTNEHIPAETELCPTEESLLPEVGTRPVYIAPNTNSKSLRGSIVVKADSIKAIESPSEEERQRFPKLFLDTLAKSCSSFGGDSIGGSGGSSGSGSGTGGGSTSRGGGGGNGRSGDGGGGRGGETKARDGETKTKDAPNGAVLTPVQEAVQRVRMGGGGANFVVVEWRNGTAIGATGRKQLEIKEVGSGGVEALADCLEAHSIMYGLVRVTETKGTSEREKFCCVKWAPEDAPSATQTQKGELQGEVSRLFHPYHGDLTAKFPSEVTPEAVAARVRRLKQ